MRPKLSSRALALLFCLSFTGSLFAEMKLTIDQLRAFIESSHKLGQPDKQVAEYLKHVKLANSIDDSTIEDLQGLGAGPKTVAALHQLQAESKSLPAAAKVIAVPKAHAPQIPAPDAAEQARILQEARDYANDYVKHLPNYICVQVIRRFVDQGNGDWRNVDKVTAKLTYFEQHEDYKVVFVNDRAVDTSLQAIGGATSQGEFGSMMKEIFAPETETRFEWERWATLRGKRMHVYSYHVRQTKSNWRVVYERSDSIVPAYHGLIYVDADTSAVMRITLEPEDMPASFPVKEARTVLDYDYIDISGQQFILPLKSEVMMRGPRYRLRNDTEYRLYRKFGAEATITYTPEPLPESSTQEQKPDASPTPKK